jgi:2,4-diaminopentanoate dehydrogenase
MARLVHVGFGALGRAVVHDLRRRGHEVVAVVDPVAEGATARDLDQVAFEDVEAAVVTTRSTVAECDDTFTRLVGRGLAVVSTCEELAFPWLRARERAEALHRLAVERGGRLLGTGVNPGFLMDFFPVVAATACREIRAVRIERVQDAAPRRRPFRDKIGAGLPVVELERRAAAGGFGHAGLAESLHFVAHYLGLPVDEWSESIEPVVGPDGLAAGIRQVARARAGGRVVVELLFHAAIGAPDARDRIVLDGDPPLELEWKGGVPGDAATSAAVHAAIPRLLAAPPGLHTMATIPLAPAGP